MVKAVGLDPQGRGTKNIEILGLNRPALVEERGQLLPGLRNIANAMNAGLHQGNLLLTRKFERQIRAATASDKRFAGFARMFFMLNGCEQYVSPD